MKYYPQLVKTFRNLENLLDEAVATVSSAAAMRRLELVKLEDEYILNLAVPGFKTNELKVSTSDGILSITGTSQKYGSIEHHVALAGDVNVRSGKATLCDGILTIKFSTKSEVFNIPVTS